LTVLEAIQKSTDFLVKRGVDSPRLQSELLLAHVLKTQRLKLYLDFARTLEQAQTTALRELVKRRGNREPLQHILGATSFCGLEIKVNHNVLVPRPETELLAEEGWKFLNSLNRPATFLDFGTGSGCIGIALCHFGPASTGCAIDKSKDALEVARENAARNKVQDRITFLLSEAFGALEAIARFDLIISNPPYIPAGEIPMLQEEVRNFDPHAALDGGWDGLDFYRLLAREARPFLACDGKLLAEFGDGQEAKVSSIFSSFGWTVERILKDYSSRPRIIVAHLHKGSSNLFSKANVL
jgi:release factor glutamine methyltransferase